MRGVKLLIHSQTSMVQLLKFGNGEVISSQTLLGMWLLIHDVIKVNASYSDDGLSYSCGFYEKHGGIHNTN